MSGKGKLNNVPWWDVTMSVATGSIILAEN